MQKPSLNLSVAGSALILAVSSHQLPDRQAEHRHECPHMLHEVYSISQLANGCITRPQFGKINN